MATERLKKQLAELFAETAEAHHQAFLATEGVDPEWPIWYADRLREPLGKALKTDFDKSRLIYCLMDADYERSARDPDAEWTGYYAEHFIERFAPAATPKEDVLVLYHFEGCPFCAIVRAAIDRLGVDVELRDIYHDTGDRDELVAARGRATVPVLRITSPDGEERWMPESRDIVRYLNRTYG